MGLIPKRKLIAQGIDPKVYSQGQRHIDATRLAAAAVQYKKLALSAWSGYNLFHYITFFESLDNMTSAVTDTGSVTLDTDAAVSLSTGTTSGSTASLRKVSIPATGYQPSFLTWDRKRRFRTYAYWPDSGSHDSYVVMGQSTSTLRRVGFKISGNKLYGLSRDGTTETTLELIDYGGVSGPINLDLEVIFTPSISAEFRVDDVSKGVISANLPSGVTNAGTLFDFYIENTAAVDRVMNVMCYELWQERY